MIYVHWLLLLIYSVAIAAAMVSVLMDRRQPAKTMAWMLVLTFMPVVGMVLYFFFGQSTRKEKMISKKSLDQLTKRSMLSFVQQEGSLTLDPRQQKLASLIFRQEETLPFASLYTEIYTDGYQFFPALLKAIAHAQHHIHINTYIFADDSLGHLIADALKEKARRGVEVRVIYDDVGSWHTSHRFFESMRESGIEVNAFMPVKFPRFTSKVNYRNHRKICVIDGETGFIGGMNIAERYVKGRPHGKGKKKYRSPWRDTHIMVTGHAVNGLQQAFLVDWYFIDRTLISGKQYYYDSANDSTFHNNSNKHAACQLTTPAMTQLATSSPTSPWPEIEQGYVRLLHEAQQYVYMETPYFLPTEPILFALRTAALSGVDVRLMIPMHVDAKLVEWASRSYVMETIEAGVKIYLYKPGFNHSKLLVCDDNIASVGSTNIDFRSFENNFEATLFVYDTNLTLKLKNIFLEDQANSILLDDLTDLEHRPFLQRLWESLVRLLSPLL